MNRRVPTIFTLLVAGAIAFHYWNTYKFILAEELKTQHFVIAETAKSISWAREAIWSDKETLVVEVKPGQTTYQGYAKFICGELGNYFDKPKTINVVISQNGSAPTLMDTYICKE